MSERIPQGSDPIPDEYNSCPFCKERIRATAIKCRFCGEWLEHAQDPPQSAEVIIPTDGNASTQRQKVIEKEDLKGPSSPPPTDDTDDLEQLKAAKRLKIVALVYLSSLAWFFWQSANTEWAILANGRHDTGFDITVWLVNSIIGLIERALLSPVGILQTVIFAYCYWDVQKARRSEFHASPSTKQKQRNGAQESSGPGRPRTENLEAMKQWLNEHKPESEIKPEDNNNPVIETGFPSEKNRFAKYLTLLSAGILAFSCVVLFLVLKDVHISRDSSQTFAEHLAGAFGRMLITSGIVAWLVGSFSKKRKGFALFGFSIAWAINTLVFAHHFNLGVAQGRQKQKEASRRMATNIVEFAQHVTNGEMSHFKPTGDADMDAALRLINSFLKDFQEFLGKMDGEIAALQPGDVFSAKTLGTKPNVDAEKRKRIESLRIINSYKNGYPEMIAAAKSGTASIPVSEKVKYQIAQGMEDAIKRHLPTIEEMYSIRMRQEQTELDFLQFMSAVFDDYHLDQESISFKTISNRKKYDELTEAVESAAADMEAFRKRQMDATEEGKKKILKLAK